MTLDCFACARNDVESSAKSLPARGRAVPGKYCDSQQALGTVRASCADARVRTQKCPRHCFSRRSAGGFTSPRLRGEVGAQRRVRGLSAWAELVTETSWVP